MVQGNNDFNKFSCLSLPPATNLDGTTSMNVTQFQQIFFLTAGIMAKLTTGGSSNMGKHKVIIAGAGGDTSLVNGYVAWKDILQVDP